MSNNITAYNPTFLAQEALWRLENALGMGSRVYMGYDAERRTYEKGDTIQMKRPSGFTVTEGGAGTLQDLATEKVTMTLDQHKEVLYTITDKERAYTGDQIIKDHINPAVYAIVNNIDGALTGLYKDIPWSFDDTTSTYADFLGCRKVLRDVAGSIVDMGDNHFAIDTTLDSAYLGLSEWKDANIIGQASDGLIKGSIGERAGIQPFVNQNLASHTSGTVTSAGTDVVGALTADALLGAVSIAVGSLSLVETIAAGDSFVIAGNTQRYVATALTTLVAGAGTVTFSPPLAAAVSSGAVVTFEDGSGTAIHAASYYSNIMFNRRAFGIAFAPLPMHSDISGADISTITSTKFPGLSIRARFGYDARYSKTFLGFDVLYGVKTLDPNMAVIYRRNK